MGAKDLRLAEGQLVDPDTGFVWDGKNREGDGKIDKSWEFSYCQGVYIGAGVALYQATGDKSYLADAARTAQASKLRLTSPVTGVLPSESNGDGGLFKGDICPLFGGACTCGSWSEGVA